MRSYTFVVQFHLPLSHQAGEKKFFLSWLADDALTRVTFLESYQKYDAPGVLKGPRVACLDPKEFLFFLNNLLQTIFQLHTF